MAAAEANPAEMFRVVEELKRTRTAPPAEPASDVTSEMAAKVRKNLGALSPEDRQLANAQRRCPVTGKPLGWMPNPVRLKLANGQSVVICCKSCDAEALENPEETLKKAEGFKKLPPILPEGAP